MKISLQIADKMEFRRGTEHLGSLSVFTQISIHRSDWPHSSLDLTLQDVLLGKLDEELEMLNDFITLVKLHI